MPHDVPSGVYLVGLVITGCFAAVVAWISNRAGKKAAAAEQPFKPQESGEHAHTRDVVRSEARFLAEKIDDRFDRLELARGLIRQSEQIGLSSNRLEDPKGNS